MREERAACRRDKRPSRGLRVRHSRESNHRIKRQVDAGQQTFEQVIEFLFRAKDFRCGFVAHLDEIFDGEIGERIGVFFPFFVIFREGALSILREFGQTFVEHDAIFERRVHSLTVERHDRVRGVTHERDLVFIIPGRAADRDK